MCAPASRWACRNLKRRRKISPCRRVEVLTIAGTLECVLVTAVPIPKLFAWREGDSGGYVLRETTSRGRCGLVCPSRTSERLGKGDCLWSFCKLECSGVCFFNAFLLTFRLFRSPCHGPLQNQTRRSRLGSLYYDDITTLSTLPRRSR
jgi:hypothetical protein